jgi:uncharacterized phage protein gp47/JayE
MDFPTFGDYFRLARDEVLTKNGNLSVSAINRDGTDLNILMASAAAMADQATTQLVGVQNGLYIQSASAQDLDRLVFDRYGLFRKQASSSLGSVEFTTATTNPATFSIPVGTLLQTIDGIQFSTTVGSVFNAGTAGPLTVSVQSVLAGSNQQAKANSITSIISQISGSPSNLRVNNQLATAGADNEETDQSLRKRAQNFFQTVRRGTLSALEEGALAVPGVTKATAIEVLDTAGRSARFVQLIISDAFTDALVGISNNSPSKIKYDAQSQQLAFTVFNALSDVRAAGVYVDVRVAQVVFQPISIGLQFEAGVNADDVAQNARVAIVNFVNNLSPNQPMLISDLTSILQTIDGLLFNGNEIVSPPGDIIPQTLQVIRTTLGIVGAVSLQSNNSLRITTNPDAFINANTTT